MSKKGEAMPRPYEDKETFARAGLKPAPTCSRHTHIFVGARHASPSGPSGACRRQGEAMPRPYGIKIVVGAGLKPAPTRATHASPLRRMTRDYNVGYAPLRNLVGSTGDAPLRISKCSWGA